MTGFIDNQLTYEGLSDDLREQIEGLHVIQSWDRAEAYLNRNKGYRIGGDKEMVVGKFRDRYPLVFRTQSRGRRFSTSSRCTTRAFWRCRDRTVRLSSRPSRRMCYSPSTSTGTNTSSVTR